MKRFHVHVHVNDLNRNIAFYSQLFGSQPSVVKPDYAKWMLDDPRLNFAISSGKSGAVGIAHLGLQAGEADELVEIGKRLKAADAIALAEAGTNCCYAHSDKFWAVDPQGVQWESFHTLGDATAYHVDADVGTDDKAAPRGQCCGPKLDTVSGSDACCANNARLADADARRRG